MNTSRIFVGRPSTNRLLSRANLELLGSGAVLLRSNRVPLLVVQLVDQLGNAEELVHLLQSHTLLTRRLVKDLAIVVTVQRLTLVSGTRNQTKINMLKQKQEKVMKAP